MLKDCKFVNGDQVQKTAGDYRYRGTVVAVFKKKDGLIRIVVENEDGMLFIFNEKQLDFWNRDISDPSPEVGWTEL